MKFAFIILCSIFCNKIYCCGRCGPIKPAIEEAAKAEIVVVAKKIKDDEGYSKIEIVKVLKGSNIPKVISVRLTYGMCHYGLGMQPNLPRVIFLRMVGKNYEKVRCSSEITVKNNKVLISKEFVAFDALFKTK